MESAIVYENPDGTIRYTVPARNSRLYRENQAEWLDLVEQHERSHDAKLKGALRLPNCRVADLPLGGFRNCWRNKGGRVEVDLPLARAQRMDEIRRARNARLEKSDGLMARARELGIQSEIDALAAIRQRLRDLPAGVDLTDLQTAEELAAFEPDWPGETGS